MKAPMLDEAANAGKVILEEATADLTFQKREKFFSQKM